MMEGMVLVDHVPKDVSALIEYSNELGSELSLLKSNTINNNIRAEYNNLSEREKEQNIRYRTNKESNLKYARVVELVDTRDLNPRSYRAGSSPPRVPNL